MRYATFGDDGALTGFYDDAVQVERPPAAIEISEALWSGHLNGEGRMRLVDGIPVLSPIPAPPRERLVERALRTWWVEVGGARAAIAGTADPVKLAEYADKAAHASAIVEGSASPALMAEAEAEAARLGLPDAAAIGALWIEMAEGLRAARTRLNVIEPGHAASIAAAADAPAIEAALAAGRAAIGDLVAVFAPGVVLAPEPLPETPEGPAPVDEPPAAEEPAPEEPTEPVEETDPSAEPDAPAPTEPEPAEPPAPEPAEETVTEEPSAEVPAAPGEEVEPAAEPDAPPPAEPEPSVLPADGPPAEPAPEEPADPDAPAEPAPTEDPAPATAEADPPEDAPTDGAGSVTSEETTNA